MKKTAPMLLLLVLWALGLAQCGGKEGLSSKVNVVLVPTNPIVVNAKLTLNPGSAYERVITPPWYIFSTSVENKTDKTLVLVTFKFSTQGIKNGTVNSTETSLDPNSGCFSKGSTRYALAVLTPYGTANDKYTNNTDSCDATAVTDVGFERWYIDSLPESESASYALQISAEGWFEDSNGIPVERFVYSGMQLTQ